jgi:hypothetical protein
MPTNHTLPSNPNNFVVKGDLDILTALNPDMGTGVVYIRDGGLFVQGLTDLDQTTINTTSGELSVYGTNRVSLDITNAIEFTATATSFFKTTAGTLTLWASAADATGKVNIKSDGTGTNSVFVNATNVTSGQVTVQSDGGSSSINSVKLIATDTTNGDILIQGAGNMAAGNPAVLLSATNTTSGQVRLTSAGSSSAIDAVQILASDTSDGNILIKGSGDFASSNPAVKILADNATSGQISLESAGDSSGSASIKIRATGATNGNVSVTADGAINPAINLTTTSAAGGQILLSSASNASAADSITLNATGTTEGNILIQSAGSFASSIPSIKLNANNATSGQISLVSAGNATDSDSISIQATGTAGGNIKLLAAGAYDTGSENSIQISASNSTSGTVVVESAGDSTTSSALTIQATGTVGGNVLITGAGAVQAGVGAVDISATNATSGKIGLTAAGDSQTEDSIAILASGTVGGNVSILGKGNFASSIPAIKLLADNATSGQISISSLGNATDSDAVSILASGTTGGNILIQGSGSNGSAVKVYSSSASGKLTIQSDGTATNTVDVLAAAGGINVNALKSVSIESADLTSGVTIATLTSGVPVTIGTGSSLTTISGDLLVQGTTTSLNTETLVVTDNIIVLNSGNGELGVDSGVLTRRYQTANNAGNGDVVIPAPVYQEYHEFGSGSIAPGDLSFLGDASSINDFYKGWWIHILDGPAAGVIRRIKSYNGITKVATIYVTADNTPQPNYFNDGLDLTTVPVIGNDFALFSAPYVGSFYSEAQDEITFATLAQTPDAVGVAGISAASIQQYQNVKSGAINVKGKTYKNIRVTYVSGNTLALNKALHGMAIGDKIRITESANITPAVPNGLYTVLATGFTANLFHIDVGAVSTVSSFISTVTMYTLDDSVIYVNNILPSDPESPGITIPGLSLVEDVVIGKTSTTLATVTNSTTYGSYLILVADKDNTNGAMSVFSASSSGTGGSINRISSSKGSDGQRISATWDSAQQIQIQHAPAGAGAGNYTYRVRITSAL